MHVDQRRYLARVEIVDRPDAQHGKPNAIGNQDFIVDLIDNFEISDGSAAGLWNERLDVRARGFLNGLHSVALHRLKNAVEGGFRLDLGHWMLLWLGPWRKLRLPLSLFFRYNLFMAKSIKVKPKKRGRPATGKNPLFGARLPKEMI